MYRQLFFSGSSFLGEALRDPVRVQEEFHAPVSLVWICSTCGEVWFDDAAAGRLADLAETAFAASGGAEVIRYAA